MPSRTETHTTEVHLSCKQPPLQPTPEASRTCKISVLLLLPLLPVLVPLLVPVLLLPPVLVQLLLPALVPLALQPRRVPL